MADGTDFETFLRDQPGAARNPVVDEWERVNPPGTYAEAQEYIRAPTASRLLGGWNDLTIGTEQMGTEAVRGLGHATAGAITGTMRYAGDMLDVVGLRPANQWWQQNIVAPWADRQRQLAPDSSAGVAGSLGYAAGDMAGTLSQIELTRGSYVSSPLALDAGWGSAVAQAGKDAWRLMAFPSVTKARNTYSDTLDRLALQRKQQELASRPK